MIQNPDMRCDKCKYWNTDNSDRDWDIPLVANKCNKAVEIWKATQWCDPPDNDGDPFYALKPEFENQGMFTLDASEYKAYLYTQPNFFCAHFEVK